MTTSVTDAVNTDAANTDAANTDHDTTDSIMASVRALLPAIAAQGAECEKARRLLPELVDDLVAAGCFRLAVPSRFGGAGAHPAKWSEMVRLLANADGSVAWTTMIGASAPKVLGRLPESSLQEMYGDGPDVIVAGAFNPTGVATPVDGGYRVRGQWSFASGCQHASWFVAHCIVDDGRIPPVRMMVLPPASVAIVDTWHTAGLCGTGSHDFAVNDVFVPDEWSFALWDQSTFDAPAFRIPELSLMSTMIASVAVGVAEGAVDEVAALANTKVPAFGSANLGSDVLFQNLFGEATGTMAALRALLDTEPVALMAHAATGAPFTPEQRARTRAAMAWAVNTAAKVVDSAYTAGGGSALYSRNPLQRRLRDAHAITQHFAVKAGTYAKAGAVLSGEEVDLLLF